MNLAKLKVIERVRKYLEKKREIDNLMREELKKSTIEYLEKPMTKAQIENYNYTLIANSAGWLGGDWTELDIKLRHLSMHCNLFTEEEYNYYRNQLINPEQKIKK